MCSWLLNDPYLICVFTCVLILISCMFGVIVINAHVCIVIDVLNYMYNFMYIDESVAQALRLTGGEKAAEMSNFINLVDKVFDSVNVVSLLKGKHKRKVFQNQWYRFQIKALDSSLHNVHRCRNV